MEATSSPLARPAPRRRSRRRLTVAALAGLLVVVALAAIGLGAVRISPAEIVAILLAPLGVELPWGQQPEQAAVLVAIRLPRVVLAALVGAALSVAGAAIQALFRNPLADPGLIGISSGSALATALVIVFAGGGVLAGGVLLPLASFAGGLGATLLVYRLGRLDGRTLVGTMLLAGVAINAFAGAGTGLLSFVSDDAQLRSLTFWTLGSFGSATWGSVAAAAPFVLVALVGLPLLARPLNAFLLGEAEAGHLGFDVERLKLVVVVLSALAVGASVAAAGIISFVGLVVPHLVRLAVGPDHRTVFPAAALLGAALVLLADLVARTIAPPAELPIGVVTAAVGAPFFLWLLLRDRGTQVL